MLHKKIFVLFTILLVLIFVSIGLICSCSDDDDDNDNNDNNNNDDDSVEYILPLATGNRWEYQDPDQDFSFQVTGTTMVNDVQTYRFINGEMLNLVMFLLNHEDGLYVYGYEDNGNVVPFDSPKLWMKYPATVGDTYIFDELERQYTVASLSETITVPAGTFTCIKYQVVDLSGFEDGTDEYWAPGVGYIYSYDYDDGEDDKLVSYTLN